MSRQDYCTACRLLFVVDCTGSMEKFKQMLTGFLREAPYKIKKALDEHGRRVEQLEIQLAIFRDFFEEKDEEAFKMSGVYNLYTEREEFEEEVNKMDWYGGGDDPESSLQALYLAMKKSPKLETTAIKKRYIVFLFTDNPSHSFEEIFNRGGVECFPEYPVNELPKDLDTFYNEYHGNEQTSIFSHIGVELKNVRLNIFAPENAYPFDTNNIGSWANVVKICVTENGRLEDVSENTLLAAIVASC